MHTTLKQVELESPDYSGFTFKDFCTPISGEESHLLGRSKLEEFVTFLNFYSTESPGSRKVGARHTSFFFYFRHGIWVNALFFKAQGDDLHLPPL